MLNITINTEAGTAKTQQTATIKAGGGVPVVITFAQNPGNISLIELALSPQSSSPEVLAYLDAFEAQSETVYTGVLDTNDTRLIAHLEGKQTVTLDCEVVITAEGAVRQPYANFPITVQPPVINGPEMSEGGPVYLTHAMRASDAEAETGSNNEKYMTPLRTAQAIAALGGLDVEEAAVPNAIVRRDGDGYAEVAGLRVVNAGGIAGVIVADDLTKDHAYQLPDAGGPLAVRADIPTVPEHIGAQPAGNYATLDVTGKVPAALLPSYVDDVLEFSVPANLPPTGETGKIYVTLSNNKCWRWSGAAYVEISPSPGSTDAVAEGSVNLYFTPGRAAAAAPVQSVAGKGGAVVLTKSDVGLGSVDNTADANKPVSVAVQAALDLKVAAGDSRLIDARMQTLFSRSAWVLDAVNYEVAEAMLPPSGRTDGASNPAIFKYNQNGGVGAAHLYRMSVSATSPVNTARQWSDLCVVRSNWNNTTPFFLQNDVDRGVVDFSKEFALSMRVAAPALAYGEFICGFGYGVPTLSSTAGATIPDVPEKGFGFKLSRNTAVPNTWDVRMFYRVSSATSQVYVAPPVSTLGCLQARQFVLHWTGTGLNFYTRGASGLVLLGQLTGLALGVSAANQVNWLMGMAPLTSAGVMQYDVQLPVIYWL